MDVCQHQQRRGRMVMKVKIVSKEYNPLLKRKEVAFEVEHSDTRGTPPRLEVRKELASKLKASLDLVYVRKVETKTGTMIAVGEANAYDSIEQAKLLEPKHIVARNTPPEKTEEKKGGEGEEEEQLDE